MFKMLFSRCLVKTHAEGMVTCQGNYVKLHLDKRRGQMEISDNGKEALIHWNGSPVARTDCKGKQPWTECSVETKETFTMASWADSLVAKRPPFKG